MPVPTPRGAVSAALCRGLAGRPGTLTGLEPLARRLVAALPEDGVLADDDLQLCLHVLYELHYRGYEEVDADWEWSPDLLAARAVLEAAFERALRRAVPLPPRPEPAAPAVAAALFTMTGADDGPSLSAFLARRATVEQLREFLVHRSVYELKEADPHTWALPRLSGRPKAALAELQADEYGGGRPERVHATLYARTMRELALDDRTGAYVDRVPAVTLATVNAMSLFGLHRRLRGAVVGHLAAFEMTSTVPNRRYADGLRRLGFGADATWFFDEHVEADAVHEQLAAHDLAGALVEDEPGLLDDVLLGAGAALELERRFADSVLRAWTSGRSSLRTPAALPVGAPV
ncbi:iron-containing redox enzyme family protein [Geodermatophilus sp. SYSU D00691]